jgi:hypothetical protein
MTAARHSPKRAYQQHGRGFVRKALPYFLERVPIARCPTRRSPPRARRAAVAPRSGAGPGRRASRDRAGAARRGPSTREISRLVVRESHRGLIASPETLGRATGAYVDAPPVNQLAVGPRFTYMSPRGSLAAEGVLCDTGDEAIFRVICHLCQKYSRGTYTKSGHRSGDSDGRGVAAR